MKTIKQTTKTIKQTTMSLLMMLGIIAMVSMSSCKHSNGGDGDMPNPDPNTEAFIYVKMAGTLSDEIRSRGLDPLKIKSLTLTGSLNGADVLCLRQMAGGDKSYNSYTKGQLKYLDISKIRFVRSNNVYFVDRGDQEHTLNDPAVFPDCMFLRCGSIETIKIPTNVTTIGVSVFTGSSIKNVYIPDGVRNISACTFMYCTNLRHITLPKSISYIESAVFANCTKLEDINIPEGVTIIYNDTFSECRSLRAITLPVSLNLIGYRAFFNCGLLSSINIPKNMTSIDKQAFLFCRSLRKISIDVIYPSSITIADNSFERGNDAILYVPSNSFYAYVGDSSWGTIFRDRIQPQ